MLTAFVFVIYFVIREDSLSAADNNNYVGRKDAYRGGR